MKLRKLMNNLEFFYPTTLAMENDNIGLLIGDERRDVKRVLTTLEITNDVIDEAIERKVELIVTHHPTIYKSLKSLNYKDPYVRMYVRLIKNNIAVYCMHTNVDIASNGVSDWIGQVLNFTQVSVLSKTTTSKSKMLSVEIEKQSLSSLVELLKKLGVGQSDGCIENFNIIPKIKYKSTFEDGVSQNEFLTIESIFAEEIEEKLKYEMGKSGFKDYTIHNLDTQSKDYGIGRVGNIKPQSLEHLAENIKEVFDLEAVRIVGDREQQISKVGVVGGSGANLIVDAKKAGCDVLITGDVGFHDAQLAIASKISIIDPGHNIEIVFNDAMADIINLFDDITAIASEVDTDPFEVIS